MSLRDGPIGAIRVPLTWTAAVSLVVAIIAALAFLLGDRRETMRANAYDQVRKRADTVTAPVGSVLSAPVHWLGDAGGYIGSYLDAANENRRLKQDLATSQKWRDEALALREENSRYRALMGVKTDPPIAMVFAGTLTDSRGPFANTRLANAGSSKGVTEGNPVLGQHGLVGRVVGVSDHVSRIMLLTDMESRTPVLVARTNARAILSGDGGQTPKLAYLRTHDPVIEGDRVLTSGDGGVYPRGLPVGVVVKGVDGDWRVALDSDASPIDYVQILLFNDFSQLAASAALAPKTLPTAMTEAPAPTPTPEKGVAPKPASAKPAAGSAAVAAPKPILPKPAGKPTVAKPAVTHAAAAKPGAAKPTTGPVAGAAHSPHTPAAHVAAAAPKHAPKPAAGPP